MENAMDQFLDVLFPVVSNVASFALGCMFMTWFCHHEIALSLFERINRRQIEETNKRLGDLMRHVEH